MALINCPECENKISDKADTCLHCGYPVAKLRYKKPARKKKIEVERTIDPRFPKVPEIMGIGKRLSLYTSKYNFRGKIKYDDNINFDFIRQCNLELSICQFGLIISEFLGNNTGLNPIKLKLHFSLIISLKKANLLQAQLHRSAKKLDIPLKEMLFCDSTTLKKDSIWLNIKRQEWKNTHILVVNYWNVEYKFPTTLVIRGSKSKISRFIDSFKMAKSNYELGIKNIPDKKGDRQYLLIMGAIGIILAIFFILFLRSCEA